MDHLTPRERDVLALVAAGLTNRQIGKALGISEHTVKNWLSGNRHPDAAHLKGALGIYRKIGVRNRVEAARWRLEHQEAA